MLELRNHSELLSHKSEDELYHSVLHKSLLVHSQGWEIAEVGLSFLSEKKELNVSCNVGKWSKNWIVICLKYNKMIKLMKKNANDKMSFHETLVCDAVVHTEES